MLNKKILISALALFTFTSAVAFAQDSPFAPEQPSAITVADPKYKTAAQKIIEDFVKNAYAPYYTINQLNSSISDFSIKDNVLTARVDLSLTKTLKAKSVDEIPYVKGLKKQLNTAKLTKTVDVAESEQVVNEKMKELAEYIGTPTEQNDSFRVVANIANGTIDVKNVKLEFLNGLVDWIPAHYFIPESEETMIQNGEKGLMEAVTTNRAFAVKSQAVKSAQSLAAVTYDRLAARDYANKYTSEVTKSPYYDTSKWNKDYKWHTEGGGVDCANYVSQAIYTGGIPTDSTWKPETTAWVNTGRNISNGLKQYMVDSKKYFYKTTKSDTAAGGFISAVKYSHVMFIVANDGVTMQFSAHTNDRLKASFANFSSSDYEFFYINSAYVK
ncbi:amidase domain-containing protein [Paenibacillus elgii]|uniref:amidase domain-containing protein n=1 Tax=Paenibacillus elgii TaxID=189691 RepID=UPI000248D763|nr:amidase domain-containing protein [Paenibacillus elgii]